MSRSRTTARSAKDEAPLATLARGAKLAHLVAQCEARVVARQWVSDDIWSPEPLWFERHQYSRGRKLAKQPAPTKDAKQYGYDATGAIARIRDWSGFLHRWHEEELFLPLRDGVLVGYRFRVDGTLLNVDRYTHDAAGRLVHHESYFADTESRRTGSQRFVWRDGLLERVNVKNWGCSWVLEWDEVGQLLAIAEVWKKQAHEIYRRPPKGETLAGLLDIVWERLRAVIPTVASKVKPKSTAYALALVVDEEEWRYLLPPSLAIGFEEDRARVRASHPDRMRDHLWSAVELPTFDVPVLELRDARLAAACKRANQHLTKRGKAGKPLLRQLVRELQALDWRALRRVSDDFVVYATSVEGDGWRDVRRDAPAVMRRRLIDRKEL